MYRALIATIAAVTLVACSDDSYKHDPEPYREQIEEIETLLMKSAPEPGDGGRLHVMCANLAGAIGPNIEIHTNRQTVQNLLISVGEIYAHLEEQDLPWDIAEARKTWKTVRDAVFKSSDWFEAM